MVYHEPATRLKLDAPATTPIRRTFRRGLVLQGGGAKGAFQFGVLQELHKNGIQFDVIAGTSVGALNGAIVAAEAWELGEELWSHLTIGRAFRLSGWAAYTVISSLGVLYLGWLTTAYDSFLGPLRWFFQLLGGLPLIAGFLAFNLTVEHEGPLLQVAFGVCTVALSTAAFFVLGKRNYFTRLQLAFYPAILWGLAAVMVGFADHKLIVFASAHKLSAVVVLLPSLSPLLLLIGFIHQRMNAALFSSSPLRKTVEAVVRAGFRQPLLATTAQTVPEYLDPDDYELTRIKHLYVPAIRSGFKPVYERVDMLAPAAAAEALLASAALPLGIVPNSRSGAKRTRFVDGGVADNTPWFPLVDLLPCEKIVVVLCEPKSAARDEVKFTRDMWRNRDRAIRVMTEKHHVPNYEMKLWYHTPPITKHDPPVVVPFRNPQFWPESETINPIVISPPKSLGNLIFGTMYFNRNRAQKNMELGREAAQLALATNHLS